MFDLQDCKKRISVPSFDQGNLGWKSAGSVRVSADHEAERDDPANWDGEDDRVEGLDLSHWTLVVLMIKSKQLESRMYFVYLEVTMVVECERYTFPVLSGV